VPRRARERLAGEAGITIVETIVAALILVGGLLSTFVVFDGSRDVTTVSERQETAVHRAERQLELVRSMPFAEVATATAPGAATGPSDPRAHVVAGSPPKYDWDQQAPTTNAETLVVSAASPIPAREPCDCGRFAGQVDTFVTSVATDLKRISVAVTLEGSLPPRRAIVASTLVSRQARRAP
jgi:hypothetical protein